MTFGKFKVTFIEFLENSTVNLGRKTSKTRLVFMENVGEMFDALEADVESVEKKSKAPNPMSGSVLRIKPADKKRALNIGKGVHAMTSSESGRADEQLNRSPFTNKKEKKGE